MNKVEPLLLINTYHPSLFQVSTFSRAHKLAMARGFAPDIGTSLLISGLWTASFHLGNFVGPTASGFMVEAWGFRYRCIFLSAAKPTDRGEGSVVLVVVVVVGGFGGTIFQFPMYAQNGCIQRKLFFKMGVSRENISLKWVYPEKTFLLNGCVQRKHPSQS